MADKDGVEAYRLPPPCSTGGGLFLNTRPTGAKTPGSENSMGHAALSNRSIKGIDTPMSAAAADAAAAVAAAAAAAAASSHAGDETRAAGPREAGLEDAIRR
jgi:hypothetical protein